MDFVTVEPSVFAQLHGFQPEQFCRACDNGAKEIGGFPVEKWARRNGQDGTVTHLRVPYRVMKRHVENGQVEVQDLSQQAAQQGMQPNLAEALQDVAVPVTGQITTGFLVNRVIGLVEQQPELGNSFLDLTAGLGTGAMTYAAMGEEDSPAWVIGGVVAGFFAMRGGRYMMGRAQERKRPQQEQMPQQEQGKLPEESEAVSPAQSRTEDATGQNGTVLLQGTS